MPNWCMNTVYVSHEDSSKIDEFKKACESSDGLFQHFVPRPESEEDNWYAWNIENWGTKWDVEGDGVQVFEQDENKISVSFDTAWGPPIEFFRKLEEDHEYKVLAYYMEEGMNFCGIYREDDNEEYELDDDLPQDLDECFGITEMLKEREEEENG